MKVVKKVLIVIVTIIILLLLAFGIYNFISIKVLKQEYTSINGYTILEVVSGSMEPTIHVGDLIVINTKESNYQENDIVTFYDVDNSFVTHRIVSINESEMITKGDNNNSEDEATPTNKIIGKYVFRINGMGKLLAAFRSPFTMMMILVIGILICYLVSTDKEGKPLLTEEEKEFQEYLKNKSRNKQGTIKPTKVITDTKKKSTSKNNSVKEKVDKKTNSAGPKKGNIKTTKVVSSTKKKSTSNKKEKGVVLDSKINKNIKKTTNKKGNVIEKTTQIKKTNVKPSKKKTSQTTNKNNVKKTSKKEK